MTRKALAVAEATISRGKEIVAEVDRLKNARLNGNSDRHTSIPREELSGLIRLGIATRIAELERELEGLCVGSIAAVSPAAVATSPKSWTLPCGSPTGTIVTASPSEPSRESCLTGFNPDNPNTFRVHGDFPVPMLITVADSFDPAGMYAAELAPDESHAEAAS